MITPMSSAHKMFQLLRQLGLKTPFGSKNYLTRLRIFTEKHYRYKDTFHV